MLGCTATLREGYPRFFMAGPPVSVSAHFYGLLQHMALVLAWRFLFFRINSAKLASYFVSCFCNEISCTK